MLRKLNVQPLNEGFVSYEAAYQDQIAAVESIIKEDSSPYVLRFLEHQPVYTIGRTFEDEHMLVTKDYFKSKGADVVEVTRGGSVTFHGPGQLIMYAHLHLKELNINLSTYLRELESWVIRVLQLYNLDAYTEKGMTGVWVNGEKICAMGIAAKKFVTYHGIGLNVQVDHEWFRAIVPCGLNGKAVTNLSEQIGKNVCLKELSDKFIGVQPEFLKQALA